jgi:crooked neck
MEQLEKGGGAAGQDTSMADSFAT